MITKYLLAWLILAIVSIANGILRQITYGNTISDLAAHQISTVTGILAIGAVVWWLSRLWVLESSSQAWTIGIVWLILTIGFEFGFGHFVAGNSWEKLLADYNILNGRIWTLFLFWVAVMPFVFFKLNNHDT